MRTIALPSVGQVPRTDAADREQLMLAAVLPIPSHAQRLASRLPPSLAMDDRINAGVIGLLNAVATYDPRRAHPLKTYAAWRIRGAMLDAVCRLHWEPRSVRQIAWARAQAYAPLKRPLGRAGRDKESAALLADRPRGMLRVAQADAGGVVPPSRRASAGHGRWYNRDCPGASSRGCRPEPRAPPSLTRRLTPCPRKNKW